MSLRCVIDNNIFDEIAGESGLLQRLHGLTARGRLELLVTSRQAEECRASAKPELIRVLTDVPVRVIGAAPFLLDVSRLGVDRLGSPEPYDALRRQASSPRHVNDHLGVATAHLEMLPFVTQEARLHGFAASIPGVDIWWWDELRTKIELL
ncbi:MAG: hypothetical protein QOC78_1276 [Solirubrobacteraceae bacterium]|nr:hypothetical protein [Solirubrobacteraceae bacterium]